MSVLLVKRPALRSALSRAPSGLRAPSPPPLARRPRHARSRGFTLVELLASIVIIALLAAMATPSFVAMMRDRRVVRAGLILVDSYREARTRALSRGNAVIVRWTAGANGKGVIETRESVIAPAGQGLATGCLSANWAAGSTDTRALTRFDFAGDTYELAQLKFFTEANVEAAFGEVCFSPQGSTYVRYVDNGVFAQLAGVPHYDVTNTRTTFNRVVYVPPNGVARLQL